MQGVELLLVSIVRALVEIALFALLGQGILAVLAGAARGGNAVYRMLQAVTRPAINAVRLLTPRLIQDRHVPALAFFLLFWLWIVLAAVKRYLCLAAGAGCQ